MTATHRNVGNVIVESVNEALEYTRAILHSIFFHRALGSFNSSEEEIVIKTRATDNDEDCIFNDNNNNNNNNGNNNGNRRKNNNKKCRGGGYGGGGIGGEGVNYSFIDKNWLLDERTDQNKRETKTTTMTYARCNSERVGECVETCIAQLREMLTRDSPDDAKSFLTFSRRDASESPSRLYTSCVPNVCVTVRFGTRSKPPQKRGNGTKQNNDVSGTSGGSERADPLVISRSPKVGFAEPLRVQHQKKDDHKNLYGGKSTFNPPPPPPHCKKSGIVKRFWKSCQAWMGSDYAENSSVREKNCPNLRDTETEHGRTPDNHRQKAPLSFPTLDFFATARTSVASVHAASASCVSSVPPSASLLPSAPFCFASNSFDNVHKDGGGSSCRVWEEWRWNVVVDPGAESFCFCSLPLTIAHLSVVAGTFAGFSNTGGGSGGGNENERDTGGGALSFPPLSECVGEELYPFEVVLQPVPAVCASVWCGESSAHVPLRRGRETQSDKCCSARPRIAAHGEVGDANEHVCAQNHTTLQRKSPHAPFNQSRSRAKETKNGNSGDTENHLRCNGVNYNYSDNANDSNDDDDDDSDGLFGFELDMHQIGANDETDVPRSAKRDSKKGFPDSDSFLRFDGGANNRRVHTYNDDQTPQPPPNRSAPRAIVAKRTFAKDNGATGNRRVPARTDTMETSASSFPNSVSPRRQKWWNQIRLSSDSIEALETGLDVFLSVFDTAASPSSSVP